MNYKKNDKRNKEGSEEGSLYFGVKFRAFDQIYPLQKISIPIKLQDHVIVETTRGHEFGVVALRKEIPTARRTHKDITVKKIIRIATEEDEAQFKRLDQDEKDAFILCVKKNQNFRFPVKFFKIEKIFDGSRYIIYYKFEDKDQNKKHSSRKKTNLSPLVSELSSQLNSKIELREVGNRGEAKLFGGMGICGNNLCCVNWNKKGSSVTVKMAKEQGLAINIPKLSGVCGRLICCLSYERCNYQDGMFIDKKKKCSKHGDH